jgi:hypothetical protein
VETGSVCESFLTETTLSSKSSDALSEFDGHRLFHMGSVVVAKPFVYTL